LTQSQLEAVMTDEEPRAPVQVGDLAPDFTLPLCNKTGSVSLADFRGRLPLLLVLERGIYCPFCRRHLVLLSGTSDRLREVGVETLAVMAAPADHARLYLRSRPTRFMVAADNDRETHRNYGLPNPPATPELRELMGSVRLNPTGELPSPVPITELNDALNRIDAFSMSDIDRQALHEHMHKAVVIVGQFLIDSEGVVRWRNVECEKDGFEGAGKFPSDDEFLAAARALG
jgi:peroxiredoxin